MASVVGLAKSLALGAYLLAIVLGARASSNWDGDDEPGIYIHI